MSNASVGEIPFFSIGGKVRGSAAPYIDPNKPLFGWTEGGQRMAVSRDDVERILAIDNDLVRIRAIAQAYHLLGRQISEKLKLRDATTWWDFATWASTTIARQVDRKHGWESGPKQRVLVPLPRTLKTMTDQFLAQANRYIFAEMGMLGVTIVERGDDFISADDCTFLPIRNGVEPTLRRSIFGEGNPELLRFGVDALREAARTTPKWTPKDDRAAELDLYRQHKVLVSSVAFLEYEQRRLHAFLDVLLSGRPFARWIELRDLRSYTGRAAGPRPFAAFRRRQATRFLDLHFRDEVVRAKDLLRAEDAEIPEELFESDKTFLRRWTTSSQGSSSADWSVLEDRMSRIYRLLRVNSNEPMIARAPFSEKELADVARGVDRRNGPPNNELWKDPHVIANDPRSTDEIDDDWPKAINRWVADHGHLSLGEMVRLIVLGEDPCETTTIDNIVSEQLFERKTVEFPVAKNEDEDEDHYRDAMRGARMFFRENVAAIGAGLFFGVLPTDLASADGALVLHQAGGFLTRTPRRVDNTSDFLFAVMNTRLDRNGSLDPEKLAYSCCEEADPLAASGYSMRFIRQTRVLHHVVRRWIVQQRSGGPLDVWSAGWTKAQKPINAEDQLATILSFTVALWYALENLGLKKDKLIAAQDDWYDAWRWIGVNLGVPTEIIPETFDAAKEKSNELAVRHLRPSHAGFELGKTLVQEMRESWPRPLNRTPRPLASQIACAAIRAATKPPDGDGSVPHEIADMLAIPRNRLVPTNVARVMLGLSTRGGWIGNQASRKVLVTHRDRMRERSALTGPPVLSGH